MRLFVALAPPPAVIADLDAACAPLRGLRDDLRWTSIDAWHVTLAFLGEVPGESLDRLVPRLERGARRHEAFWMSFRGAGAFPAAGRANVLWSGLAGDRRALAELAATVTAAARRADAAPPDAGRRYRPHLTLARCRAPADVQQIVASLNGYEGPAWRAEELYLIRSNLTVPPRGASPPLRPPSGGEAPLTPPFPGEPGTDRRAPGLPAYRAGEDPPSALPPAGVGTASGLETPPRFETLGRYRLRAEASSKPG